MKLSVSLNYVFWLASASLLGAAVGSQDVREPQPPHVPAPPPGSISYAHTSTTVEKNTYSMKGHPTTSYKIRPTGTSKYGLNTTLTKVPYAINSTTVGSPIFPTGKSNSTTANSTLAHCASYPSATSNATGEYQGYRPVVQNSYQGCVLDPNDPRATFEVLDPDSGQRVVDNNGHAALTDNDASQANGAYSFIQSPGAPCGVFDMVYRIGNGLYFVAIYSDGSMSFRAPGSNGQAYRPSPGTPSEYYVTSVFSMSCDGFITAGIVNGHQFAFYDHDGALYARNNTAATQTKFASQQAESVRGLLVRPIR